MQTFDPHPLTLHPKLQTGRRTKYLFVLFGMIGLALTVML